MIGAGDVFKFKTAPRDELHKSFVFAFLPTGIIEVFVEGDNRTCADLILQRVEDGFSRRVKVAVDVNERALFGVSLDEFGQSFVEPAFDEPNVRVDFGQDAFTVESRCFEAVAPRFGQTFKAVEAVNNFVGQRRREEIYGFAREDAEFQIPPIRFRYG